MHWRVGTNVCLGTKVSIFGFKETQAHSQNCDGWLFCRRSFFDKISRYVYHVLPSQSQFNLQCFHSYPLYSFVTIGLFWTLLGRDHYHLKECVWPTHLGITLHERIKVLLSSILNSYSQNDYDLNADKVYAALASYPNHDVYFKIFFEKYCMIARWYIVTVRGGLCFITSAPSEQVHSSNEAHVPTKLLGSIDI